MRSHSTLGAIDYVSRPQQQSAFHTQCQVQSSTSSTQSLQSKLCVQHPARFKFISYPQLAKQARVQCPVLLSMSPIHSQQSELCAQCPTRLGTFPTQSWQSKLILNARRGRAHLSPIIGQAIFVPNAWGGLLLCLPPTINTKSSCLSLNVIEYISTYTRQNKLHSQCPMFGVVELSPPRSLHFEAIGQLKTSSDQLTSVHSNIRTSTKA